MMMVVTVEYDLVVLAEALLGHIPQLRQAVVARQHIKALPQRVHLGLGLVLLPVLLKCA